MTKTKTKSVSRALAGLSAERYALETDGRNGKHVATERMALVEWLSTFGNPDGSRIFPSVKAMERKFRWSRRKVFMRLDDLEQLHILTDSHRLSGYHGTRIRQFDPLFLAQIGVQSSWVGVQSTEVGVQSSGSRSATYVAHNQPTVPPTPPPTLKEQKAAGGGLAGFDQQGQEQGKAEGDEASGPEWTEDDERDLNANRIGPFLRALKRFPEITRSGITAEKVRKAYKDVRHALTGTKYKPFATQLTERAWERFLEGRDLNGIKKANVWFFFDRELLTDWLRLAIDDLKNGRLK